MVVAAQSMAAAHSATEAARWQQRGGCSGFAGTVRECANARAFESHQGTNVRVFVLGNNIRIVGLYNSKPCLAVYLVVLVLLDGISQFDVALIN